MGSPLQKVIKENKGVMSLGIKNCHAQKLFFLLSGRVCMLVWSLFQMAQGYRSVLPWLPSGTGVCVVIHNLGKGVNSEGGSRSGAGII